MIWRKDAVDALMQAIVRLQDPSEGPSRGPSWMLGEQLRQIQIAIEHGGGGFPLTGGEAATEPCGAVNEYEQHHRQKAAAFLVALRLGESSVFANTATWSRDAVAHIVEAAAHRVMSQVIGAIEKTKAAPPVNVVGYDALLKMARDSKAARKPKKVRRNRKAARK